MLKYLISLPILVCVLATNYKFVAFRARLGDSAPPRLGTRLTDENSVGLKKVGGQTSSPKQCSDTTVLSYNPKRAIVSVFGDDEVAMAIAMAESRLNCKAISKTNDYGLFQINKIHLWRFEKRNLNPFNCYHNALVAYEIYKERGWHAWSAFKNGSYKKFLGYKLNKN